MRPLLIMYGGQGAAAASAADPLWLLHDRGQTLNTARYEYYFSLSLQTVCGGWASSEVSTEQAQASPAPQPGGGAVRYRVAVRTGVATFDLAASWE